MKRTILLAAGTGIAVGAVFAGLVVAGAIDGGGTGSEPLQKQAVETAEALKQLTAAAGTRAPKPISVTPIPTTASCPVDTSTIQTQVTGPIYPPPPGSSAIFDRLTLVAEATAVGKDGRPYSLYFGNLRDDPSQWVIVRWRGAKDPCVEGRPDYDPELLPLPFKATSVTLDRIDNSSVYFAASDGERGTFDYTNAVFSTTAPP